MMKFGVAAVAAAATLALAGPANAGVLEHFQIKVGVSDIIPSEHGSPIQASISDAVVPTLGIEYFFNDHVSAELLCCAATHDVSAANGAVDLGSVTHSPPTLTLKYRWNTETAFQPYVGAGVNYTMFINSDPPAGRSVHYSNSWGGALQAGFDYRLNDHWAWNVDVRRLWISTDVRVRNPNVTDSVDIDPWVVTTGVGYRF